MTFARHARTRTRAQSYILTHTWANGLKSFGVTYPHDAHTYPTPARTRTRAQLHHLHIWFDIFFPFGVCACRPWTACQWGVMLTRIHTHMHTVLCYEHGCIDCHWRTHCSLPVCALLTWTQCPRHASTDCARDPDIFLRLRMWPWHISPFLVVIV